MGGCVMFCTNCGCELDENTNFCTNCGTKVRQFTKENVESSRGSSERLFIKKSDGKNEDLNKDKEKQLEQKFGVQFQNKLWFECTIEEMRHSTFSNTNNRDVVHGYVILEDTFLEIIKESVFLKSKMGARKLFYENIASIDYDARGKLHLGSNLEINLKSSEKVQLKYVDKEIANLVTSKYNDYMENKISNNGGNILSEGNSNVDELMKYADLFERGLLTKEEFEQKKKELL